MSDWFKEKVGACALLRQCGKAEGCLKQLDEWKRNGCPTRWTAWHNGVRVDCKAGLNPRLINYEKHRIEVSYADGSKSRFWVAISTGIMPIHIAIRARNTASGPAIDLPDDATFRVIYGPEKFHTKGRLR